MYMAEAESRKILVFAHTGRKEAREAARQACTQLYRAGLTPVMNRSDLETLTENWADPVPVQVVHESVPLIDIELGVVLGGDGSILRAAEMVRRTTIPLVGVNLGHVGFLAESEESDLGETVERIVSGEYTVEERMAIEVEVWHESKRVHTDWALNEVSVEKGNREKMIEVIIEVDRKPLSTFGCDGVVMGTPTGSTAPTPHQEDPNHGHQNERRQIEEDVYQIVASLVFVTEINDLTLLLFNGEIFVQLIDRAEVNIHIWMCSHLLGRHIENIANILGFDIHSQRTLILIDHHTLCVTFLDILFKPRVSGLLAGSVAAKRLAATRKKQYDERYHHDGIDPIHIESGHLRLLIRAVKGIVVIVHLFLID